MWRSVKDSRGESGIENMSKEISVFVASENGAKLLSFGPCRKGLSGARERR
jgi:hypothetical protein